MPSYISDASGSWFKVSDATLLNVQTGITSVSTATSGLTADGTV